MKRTIKMVRVIDARKRKLLRSDYKDFVFHPDEEVTDENILVKCAYCKKRYIEYVVSIEDEEGDVWGDGMCKDCASKEYKKLKLSGGFYE
jgi:hypothetical protein